MSHCVNARKLVEENKDDRDLDYRRTAYAHHRNFRGTVNLFSLQPFNGADESVYMNENGGFRFLLLTLICFRS